MPDSRPAPLDGIRVIDLSRVVSGPWCTMTLGDMGADVVKIEEPGRGDESRAFGPPFLGAEAPYFLSVNRNKRSCTVNLKHEAGRAIVWRLVAGADVVVQNFRPGRRRAPRPRLRGGGGAASPCGLLLDFGVRRGRPRRRAGPATT